jgi:NAD(P)-dependent dehydrogenase (short-subunit alcohol dehydrogenase family)
MQMGRNGSVVVIGGTSGLGKEIARHYAKRGRDVIISGRDAGRAGDVARELGGGTVGIAVDLTDPQGIAAALRPVGEVDRLVIAAIERDENRIREYDVGKAMRLTTLKLVGYPEVVHVLAPRLTADASVLLFGGLAKERPYPGSTTVTTVNGAITTMIRTLAFELAPIRVNALHPGIVGDSPYWASKPQALEAVKARTPTGRLVTMEDVVDAAVFLLENRSMNVMDLFVDGGWLLL